jgi:hypothetical protein
MTEPASNRNHNSGWQRFWNVASIALTVLGLAGLADALAKWSRFASNLLEHFHGFIAALFGWIPVHIPYWLQVYLVLGLAYIAATQAIPDDYGLHVARRLRGIVIALPIMLLFWPFSFMFLLIGVPTSDSDIREMERARRLPIIRNLAISVGLLAVLLFLFADFSVGV